MGHLINNKGTFPEENACDLYDVCIKLEIIQGRWEGRTNNKRVCFISAVGSKSRYEGYAIRLVVLA